MTAEMKPMSDEERIRLIGEVGRLRREAYPAASDEAWRRERLYRYLYWREHHEHAPTNLVGGWELDELRQELRRWQDFIQRGLGENAVLDLLTDTLADTYGKSWVEALEEGTSPLLAKVGQPVWHADTGSLLPQKLGHLGIFNTDRYDDPDLGWAFNYGNSETRQKLTVILFTLGCDDIADGIGDPRLEQHFGAACRDLIQFVEANGGSPIKETFVGPVRQDLRASHGRPVQFVAAFLEAAHPTSPSVEALSMRGFRGHWMKIRYSREKSTEDKGEPGLNEINSDVAEFVAHFT